jgi:hypothetical protein
MMGKAWLTETAGKLDRSLLVGELPNAEGEMEEEPQVCGSRSRVLKAGSGSASKVGRVFQKYYF